MSRCKLNPCCGDPAYCIPPSQPDHNRRVEKEINSLIDTHAQLYEYERSGLIREDRTDYMRFLIEMELMEKGHPLKGIPNLSRRTCIR